MKRRGTGWFEVDRAGLARLTARRGREFVLAELVQNAWDEPGVSRVDATVEYVGRGIARLVVEDDAPDGFADLTHAYRLFAESKKKGDPSKRGRFNLGEKLVLALCRTATVESTRGTITFGTGGVRRATRRKRAVGTRFSAEIRMSRDDVAAADRLFARLIPPDGIVTTLNGRTLPDRPRDADVRARLTTEIAGPEDGVLRRTKREATINIYAAPGDGWLYELGIPVVEIGGPFDVDVRQRVPLNMERDNVTPAYLRDVRAAVFNAAHGMIDGDGMADPWVTDASGAPGASPDAVRAMVAGRFGAGAVAYDPSDPQANKSAVANGVQVIHGRTLTKEQWANVRDAGAAPPAGRVYPTPKPYSEGGTPEALIPRDDWTAGMRAVAETAERIAMATLGVRVDVRICRERHANFSANYARVGEFSGDLCFNVGRLGRKWFDEPDPVKVVDLIIHELGHHVEGDHLSKRYYGALTSIGGRLAVVAALDRYPESNPLTPVLEMAGSNVASAMRVA